MVTNSESAVTGLELLTNKYWEECILIVVSGAAMWELQRAENRRWNRDNHLGLE